MSGGYFNHNQYAIDCIIFQLEDTLEKQGKPVTNGLFSEEYYAQYPQDRYYPVYSEKLQQEIKKAIKYLKKAKIYAHRIDWFLSGDDSEETFYERLNKELKQL